MTNIKVRKSPGPALAAALLAACGVMIISFFIMGLLAPFKDPNITPAYFWKTVWNDGFLRYCGTGLQAFSLDCRTANIRAWLIWPPFSLRLGIFLGGTMIAAILAAIWSWKHASPKETVRTIRGPRPLFGAEGRAALRKAIAVSGAPQPDSLWLAPHVQLTPVAEAANILVIGDQGSGKSAMIRGWAEQILARKERSIIHDAKGDILACAPIDRILLVAPHDARGWNWDIGRDVTNAQGAREVADKLVPSGSELESMWSNGAKAILSGAIEALQRERKTDWGWADLFQFPVSSLFGALRGALRPLLVSPFVELIFDSADEMPELVTDEAKLAQILRNLVSNALKFTEKGEVRVRARYEAEPKLAIFSVRDTGIGIARQDQTRIFEEFSQVDTRLQKKTKGTGLGLPLSRSLAELIGGTIRVESVLGQGSVFTLAIPASLGGAAAPAAELSKKRVLIIDDDDTFRYILRQIIANEPRYEVLEASNGGDGLLLAKNERPDVIVLDLQMPHVDGFTVLQELSADPRTSIIPVVVSTSLAVNAELKARLPVGARLISKNLISRENVSLFLRDATGSQVSS